MRLSKNPFHISNCISNINLKSQKHSKSMSTDIGPYRRIMKFFSMCLVFCILVKLFCVLQKLQEMYA